MDFNIRIAPLIGIMVGVNFADWGEEHKDDHGFRYEVQIGLGLFIIAIYF